LDSWGAKYIIDRNKEKFKLSRKENRRMGILFNKVQQMNNKNKSQEKLKRMRIDIRLGLSVGELSKKYNISECSARNYRTNYLKTIEKQKEMSLNG
jgi:hypothetical protein